MGDAIKPLIRKRKKRKAVDPSNEETSNVIKSISEPVPDLKVVQDDTINTTKNIAPDSINETIGKKTRKPGRPRTKPKKNPIPIDGIVSEPKKPNHIVELYYHSPNNLKKIIQFLHQESVSEIFISFKRTKMILVTEDAVHKSKIKLVIDGFKVNRYYCPDAINVELNFDDLKILGDKLDGSYESITFIVDKDRKRQSLDFLLATSVKIEEMTNVIVNDISRVDDDGISLREQPFTGYIDEKDYPLSFELGGKYLKKMIIDAKNAGGGKGQLRIYKNGKLPLEFSYASDNKRVQETRTLLDEASANVQSTLEDGNILSAAIFIDYIKPLTSFLANTDAVKIYCSKVKPVVFEISIEKEVFKLIIIVDVVDLRQINRVD